MYLAEDRVSALNHTALNVDADTIDVDPLLGVGIETGRFVDSALCQIGVCCDGCTRSSESSTSVSFYKTGNTYYLSGTRIDITTSSLAERLVLRRGPLHLALLLHLPLGA